MPTGAGQDVSEQEEYRATCQPPRLPAEAERQLWVARRDPAAAI
ncbi:MAG: hypothetical protein R3A46_16585 [Thermomicrobiales bacterium]